MGTIPDRVAGSFNIAAFGRYFAWSLFQEFGLQSFFTNRLYQTFNGSKKSAWAAGAIFAMFHIPNPLLMPLTFAGGVILSKVFIENRNLMPLALSHAIIGSLASIAIPVAWHHGLRVGPGYFRWVPD
jgi:membrane protease YdiL (CAAX protease family)